MMKPVRIAVYMKEPAFGRAVARGLAESGNGFLIEVMEPGAAGMPESSKVSGAERRGTWMCRTAAQDVLVTDCGPDDLPADLQNDFQKDFPGMVVVDPETCRISNLCRQVMAAADQGRESRGGRFGESPEKQQSTWEGGRRNEKRRSDENNRPTECIGFLGLWGGCGVTALAVTAGRMLGGAYGEKVLYLPLTERDGAVVYRETDLLRTITDSGKGQSGACPQRGKELLYRLAHGLTCSVERFMLQDGYGLEMPERMDFLSVKERVELLTHLAEKGGYDWILVDLGSRECFLPQSIRRQAAGLCSVVVEVGNRMDSRCMLDLPQTPDWLQAPEEGNSSAFFPERRIMVWNHGAENRMEENLRDADQTGTGRMTSVEQSCLEIAHDGESFLADRDNDRIEISMTKNFAIGVKNLTEILINFQENDLRNMSNEIGW